MDKLEFSTSGTLGDAYITLLKLMTYGNVPIRVFHFTECPEWKSKITEIYSLLPNVEVEFVDVQRFDLIHVDSTDKNFPQIFFPEFNKKYKWLDIENYIVIQAHSGKDVGRNSKKLSKKYLDTLIQLLNKYYSYEVVILLGTDKEYSTIKDCLNLIGKTDIQQMLAIISNAREFIGPEGLGAFMALSHRVLSTVFYASELAVQNRILGTPWEKYCDLRFFNEYMGYASIYA